MLRILALVPGGIGDQILFFPTLTSLHTLYPSAQLDVIVEPRSAPAYEVCPYVDDVLLFNFKEAFSLGDISDLVGRIRERQYDAVLSLGRRWPVRFLLWLTGIPKRVGFGEPGFGLTDAVPLKEDQYAASLYHDLLQGFGYRGPVPPLQVRVKQPALDWAKQERQRLLGSLEQDYVLIHPGASELSVRLGLGKIYPVGRWVEIIQAFRQRRPELPLVLIAGPDDQAVTAQFREQLPDLPVTSPPRIGQLTALIAGASLLLCTDSAPMHLAVATQTPLVALFGPTDPARLLPKEGPYRYVKANGGAIETITPDQVIQTIFPG
ncbi:MAG: glycosyltransferase family 9 protein [Thermostichales cyanobacterium BF4_bins_65]